ncbi:MAG TPA: hypothetical protein VK461_14925 [Acidimicrobiales bacterium]|nr:hypothetical protein [Acidimicrobiales bacterium]
MDSRVTTWVRIGVVVTLAVPQLLIGLWAVLAPHHWYENFPGVHPHLIAAEPPYNQHLATDAGLGFLCTGVGLIAASLWGRRVGLYVALITYAAFAVPHVLYHALHPAEALSTSENVTSVLFLLAGVALAAVFAWGASQRPRISSDEVASFVHSARDPAGP